MCSRTIYLSFVVLSYFPFSSAAAFGTLAFYVDEVCQKPSIINPTVNIPADTCLVTPGALGISVYVLPPCTSGEATFLMYHDASCARPLDMDLQYQNCYFNGPLGVKALQFVCKDVAGGSVPTTTTTATFGSSSMPIATGAVPTPNPGASQPASPSSNGAVTTPNPSSSSQASDGSSAGSGSGLSHNTQIALGVGVPIAALLVAFLAWQFPKNIRHREAEGHAMVRPPLANSPANSPYNPPYHSTMNLHFNTNQTQPDNRNYGLHQQAYSPGNGRW